MVEANTMFRHHDLLMRVEFTSESPRAWAGVQVERGEQA